ncbi:sugar ABC transporter substrate-binding protein [Alkalibacter rhizosphaerae]|uniref:Sugar ABC transporter substrate-binding protein n=1 Tax=Alkalibacter rhizosphaerae TaxID=2815577 RepID=A0A974XGG8_9FIRM|nr:sugar ABC transporter substrate-binding protein [Alkalibacter rhizosphaerae]QSX09419.1 sugar ABC transporter substrate-binding protein [Alkalibacter rhizosphaerae]
MKRERFKWLALLLVLLMLSASLIGCGGGDADNGDGGSDDPANGDNGGEEISAFDQLMAKSDRLPLSGLQPLSYDDRSDIEKALPVEQKDDVTIGWAGAFLGSTFFEEMVGSARTTAEKYGYTFLDQNANFNLQTQLTQMDTYITQGVDVIVLNAVELDSTVADITRAVQAGIPVIVTGPRPADPSYPIVTNVISGSFNSGYEIGLFTAGELYTAGSEPLKMGFALSMMDSADAQSRTTGLIAGYLYKAAEIEGKPYETKWDAVLEAYEAWITIRDTGNLVGTDMPLDFVGYGTGESTDAAAGQIASSDLLTANPDMDILLVETDTMLPGALTEVRQQGLTAGEDIKIVCAADGTREALEYIKEGSLFATATNIPYYNGEKIVELIHKMYAEGFDANNLPSNSFTPTMAIHAGNVDEYYDANAAFALAGEWDIMTIEEYNAANK